VIDEWVWNIGGMIMTGENLGIEPGPPRWEASYQPPQPLTATLCNNTNVIVWASGFAFCYFTICHRLPKLCSLDNMSWRLVLTPLPLRGKFHARARVWRSKTKLLPSSREKKKKEKNSYITRGIKGPVYSLQVALSGGAAYKESYLVIFLVNQTSSRPGSFWCGRNYSSYKQGHVFGLVHRPPFLARHAGLTHWMPLSTG